MTLQASLPKLKQDAQSISLHFFSNIKQLHLVTLSTYGMHYKSRPLHFVNLDDLTQAGIP